MRWPDGSFVCLPKGSAIERGVSHVRLEVVEPMISYASPDSEDS